MPIDPTLSLKIIPPRVEDPVEQFGKLQSIRNMVQQGQMHQQQMLENAEQLKRQRLQNHQAEVAAASQETARRAYVDSGGDPDKWLTSIRGNVDPETYQKAEQHILDLRTKAATLKKDEIAIEQDRAQRSSALTMQGQQMTPEQWAQNYPQWRDAYHSVDPKAKLPDEPIPQESLQFISLGHATEDMIFKQEDEKRKVADEKRKAAEAPVTLATKQQDLAAKQRTDAAGQLGAATTAEEYKAKLDALPHGVAVLFPPAEKFDPKTTPALVRSLGMTAEQQTQATQAAANAAATAKQHEITNQNEKARIGIERGNAARAQKQFDVTYGSLLDADGKPLEPEAAKAVAMQDPIAVAVANYQTPPPNVSRGGPGAGILRKVLAINPEYNAQTWTQQGQMVRDYGPGGKVGKTLMSTNIALGHLNALSEAADALDNGNIQVLNRLANGLGVQVGGTAKQRFDTIVHRVGPEIAAAYGEGTGGERGKIEADFSSSNAPGQNKTNIAATANLFRSKLAAAEEPWKAIMGKRPLPVPMTTEATRAMERVTGGEKVKLQAPDGTVKEVSAAEADHYIKRGAKKVP